jgi:hypothetical protein
MGIPVASETTSKMCLGETTGLPLLLPLLLLLLPLLLLPCLLLAVLRLLLLLP